MVDDAKVVFFSADDTVFTSYVPNEEIQYETDVSAPIHTVCVHLIHLHPKHLVINELTSNFANNKLSMYKQKS